MKTNKTSRVYLRVTPDKKKELKRIADRAGITVSDLILARLENVPIKDYQKENEFLLKLNDLTQELGHIGNNINQVTVAIHQMKNTQVIDQERVSEFNSLMRQYLEKRTELSDNLQKAFFA